MTYDFTKAPSRAGTGAEKWHGITQAQIQDQRVTPFSIADMDLMCAPEIIEALTEAAAFGIYGYTGADQAYQKAVAGWMARRHHWQIQPEWIVNTFGVVHALNQAVHAFTQPGDGVVIQTPVYPPFFKVVEATGRTVLENPLVRRDGRYEMDLEQLESVCARPEAKLMFLCSPHNPAGRVWTRTELQQVADICARNGVLVFSDEIHFDFTYPGHPHTIFATLEGEAARRCIVGTSASKSFNLAGLATANIIIPDGEVRRRFQEKATGYTGSYTGYFGLAATRAAYERAEGWLDQLLVHLEENWTFCRDTLARTFPSVTVYPMEGTYLLWADFRSLGLTPGEQARFMREEALLWLDEGDMFGPAGAGFERINLACTRQALADGLERLDQAARRRGLPR